MKLGYRYGYEVPKCPACDAWMYNALGNTSDLVWTFRHCDNYYEVTYVKQGRKYVLS